MSHPALPESLSAKGARSLRQLELIGLDDATTSEATRVFALSEFAASAALRQRDWLVQALEAQKFARAATPEDLGSELDAVLAGADNLAVLQRGLRQVRLRYQLWLVWRHLSGAAALEETISVCSLLADTLIDAAYRRLYEWACARRGTPWGEESDSAQHLVVFGLGKLGGGELNLSSDVDLIFAYPERGQTRPDDGTSPETNQQFFVRLGQELIQALDPVTVDGFVFRVDMRLRPFGASGPLVMDFQSLEDYYATQGRDWERYALMKARPCAGDVRAGHQLLGDLRPFVYRRYLDFGAIDALRDMKQKLIAERQHPDDVKLGAGGIRDVEFSVQMLQMIWGGRQPLLQSNRLLEVVPQLQVLGHLSEAEALSLQAGYRFLRDTEHDLQAQADRQTQRLPGSEEGRLQVAVSRGFDGFDAFHAALDEHRERVAAVFDALISPAASADSTFDALWREPEPAELAEAGFREPTAALECLKQLAIARDRRSVSEEGRQRLDRLMPVLLETLTAMHNPDLALARVTPVVRAVLRRSAYLALLSENTRACRHFVELVTASLFLADNLAEHPAFLDALLDDHGLQAVPERAELTAKLEAKLADAPDLETRLDVLREFRSHHVFDVALAEVRGSLPLMRVSDALTWLAEAILEAAVELAWQENLDRFPEFANERAFIVVGYGKLGGIELGPGSDLDLVFLHDLPGLPGPFLHRFVRRLLHVLTAPTYQGALYEIDTRLRPSGSAGTMVSSLSAFDEYQRGQAWVWEHQALVRARVVAGDPELAARFAVVRRELLCLPRDTDELRAEVLQMRRRISEHHDDDADLKRGAGGIVDIEFMVQYLVLAWAHLHPSLTEFTDNVRILEAVERLELLPATMTSRLREAYVGLRAEGHRSVLDIPDRSRTSSVLAEYRNDVRAAWRRVFEDEQN